jgi:hypothetical protein
MALLFCGFCHSLLSAVLSACFVPFVRCLCSVHDDSPFVPFCSSVHDDCFNSRLAVISSVRGCIQRRRASAVLDSHDEWDSNWTRVLHSLRSDCSARRRRCPYDLARRRWYQLRNCPIYSACSWPRLFNYIVICDRSKSHSPTLEDRMNCTPGGPILDVADNG